MASNDQVPSCVLWRQADHNHKSQKVSDKLGETIIKPLASTPWRLDPRVFPFVEEAGFGEISKIKRIVLDHALVSAMVERWRRETHTFHLRVGEMTITLQDVAMILGLPIVGYAVTDTVDWDFDFQTTCKQLLGTVPPSRKRPQPDQEQVQEDDGRNIINVSWLSNTFSSTPPLDAGEDVLRQYARAYILYVVGTFLFPSGKQNHVATMYLPLLVDLAETRKYSWGSATLAYLYSGLCAACEGNMKTLRGCGLLLQIWCWEHLHCRPQLKNNARPIPGGPLSTYWNGAKTWTESGGKTLKFYRNDLDQQEPKQVNWMPYHKDRLAIASNVFVDWQDVYLCVVPLIHFNNIEWYRPNQVLRQFGFVQDIPVTIDRCEDETHKTMNRIGKAGENWQRKYAKEIEMWNNSTSYIIHNLVPGHHCTPEYESWYHTITRLYIGSPKARNLPEDVDQEYHPQGRQLQKMIDATIQGAKIASQPNATVDDFRNHMKLMLTYAGQSDLSDKIENLNVTQESELTSSRSTNSRRKRHRL